MVIGVNGPLYGFSCQPCGSLTSISERSTKGRGIVSKEGSRSLFLFRSSNRKERTAASRGGGATPLNWRKFSLQRQTENCIHYNSYS